MAYVIRQQAVDYFCDILGNSNRKMLIISSGRNALSIMVFKGMIHRGVFLAPVFWCKYTCTCQWDFVALVAIFGTTILVPYLHVKWLQITWRSVTRSSNELQRLDYMTGYQDISHNSGHQGDLPHWPWRVHSHHGALSTRFYIICREMHIEMATGLFKYMYAFIILGS